jgi:sulfate transporter 4
MLIPQSMSYAKIAGLDYKYGLYSGMVPLMLYACTCSSRQIQVGPVAIVSLLMEAVLDGFLTDDECPKPKDFKDGTPQWEYCQDAYAQAAMVTTLIAGLYQLAAAALQLGFLVSFLSAPVISGFTTGASITIAFSQVQYLVGYKVPRSNHLNETLYNIFRWDQLKNFNYVTFLLGTSFWFALWAARKISAKHKRWFGWLKPCAPLAICIIGILVGGNFNQFGGCGFVQCAGAEGKNVRLVVGPITPGLPPYEPLNLSMFSRASGPAISVAIVS